MILLESFTFLLHDAAHWKFELFVGGIEMLVFDVFLGALVWPFIKHHIHRDQATEHEHEQKLEARIEALEEWFGGGGND